MQILIIVGTRAVIHFNLTVCIFYCKFYNHFINFKGFSKNISSLAGSYSSHWLGVKDKKLEKRVSTFDAA